ncbi:MAG: TolC family protein, partial [Acidobacteria bacterium]|nr:TolC family protein [Acidobacteriota bacterium]
MRTAARQLVFFAATGMGLQFALLPAMAQHQHTHPNPSQPQSRPQEAAAQRQSDGLRLEDLLGMAAQNNPVLKKADADIRAAEGRRRQAGLYPNPSVGYTGDEIARGPIVRGGEHGFFVEQTIVTAGKLGNRRELFSREVEQAEVEAEIQRFHVTNAVRQLFYQALAVER